MGTVEISEVDVLDFVKKELYAIRNTNQVIIFYGVGAKDIVKFIETPEKCGKWPFDFVCTVTEAIKKIKRHYIVPYPEIETQTEEDRVLSKLLAKYRHNCFGTNTFFEGSVSLDDVIHYMNRNVEIKNWNASFLRAVQMKTARVKEFLL
ncbi:MAG: hypothetical protein EAY72_08805 [Bacteroidetes bacterium]|nr:MAG: hypothetical protein EAY72_08805 [Bacteroidota bacterium]